MVRLQLALRAAGYSKVPTNGTFGKATVTVVKAAQKRLGLKQTGVVTAALWKALQKGRITAPFGRQEAGQDQMIAQSSKGKRALADACKQLGDGYRYGGTGPNKLGTAPG